MLQAPKTSPIWSRLRGQLSVQIPLAPERDLFPRMVTLQDLTRLPHLHVPEFFDIWKISAEISPGAPGCRVRLQVGAQTSGEAPRDGPVQKATFTFAAPVPYGLHQGSLLHTAGPLGPMVATVPSPGGLPYLLARSEPQRRTILELYSMAAREFPWKVAAYTACLAGLLGCLAALLGGWTMGGLLGGLGCVILCHVVITPPFAGYDETAHLTMLRQAAPGARTPDLAFYQEALSEMKRAYFFRLNPGVTPVTPGACPNLVAGQNLCGEAEGRKRLYGALWVPIAFLKGTSSWTTAQLLDLGKGFNILLTGAAFVALCFLGRTHPPLAWALGACALLCAPFLSQLPSVTDDVPAYLLGFLLLWGLGRWADGRLGKLSLVALSAATALYACAGRSFIAALPMLGTLWILSVFPQQGQIPPRRRAVLYGAGGAIAGWMLPTLLLVPLVRALGLSSGIGALLGSPPPLASRLVIFALHERSIAGSYIWGHSKLPMALVPVFLLGLAALGLLGVLSRRNPLQTRSLVLLGGCLGVQWFLNEQICAPFSGKTTAFIDTWAKIRVTAPGIAGHFAFVLLGLMALFRAPRLRKEAGFLILSWALVLTVIFLPMFFWGDLL